jgi:PKD repeat protein
MMGEEKMNRKIFVIFVTLVMIVSTFVIAPNDLKVEASGGGSGGDIGIDFQYIYNITENLSNVIFDAPLDHGIRKGRAFGTEGERHAAENIISLEMENLNLHDPTSNPNLPYLEQIENINYPHKIILYNNLNLTDKLEVLSKRLTIHENNNTYDVECFISPTWNNTNSSADRETLLTKNFSYTGLKIRRPNETDFDDFLDFAYSELFINWSLSGSVTLENFAIQLLEEYYNFTYENIDPDDNSTWPSFVEPIDIDEEYVEFQVNKGFNPDYNDPDKNNRSLHPIWSEFIRMFKIVVKGIDDKTQDDNIVGKISYDYDPDCHDSKPNIGRNMPVIHINGTDGETINNTLNNCTVDFYVNQRFNTSVVSYNVIGQIDGTDQSKTVIVSSLYDSMWCQGTADSAIGVGIVMALAKYLKDNNITPKYNLKFIAFGGEEYGLRGAKYYEEYSHNEGENIVLVIDVNQVGFYQPDPPQLTMHVITNKLLGMNKISNIIGKANYEDRTTDGSTIDVNLCPIGSLSNDMAFASVPRRINCRTVMFLKDFGWTLHHRDGRKDGTGELHTAGDVMDYYNETEVALTAEMIWNVTKYFTVNPNCWFKPDSISVQTIDSGSDSNTIPDEVQVSFTINTIMPNERATVRAFLKYIGDPKYCFFRTPLFKVNTDTHYIVKSSQDINGQINIELPRLAPKGKYSLHLYLYNSTGEIKDHIYNMHSGLFLNTFYSNQTEFITIDEEMQGQIDTPNTPTNLDGPSELNAGSVEYFSYKASYPAGGKISFQNDWGSSTTPVYENQDGLYNSLETCNTDYMWTDDGDIDFRVRARDEALSPNVWSDWSNNLDITVNPGCRNVGPGRMVLDHSYEFQCYDYDFTGVNWTVNFSYFDEAFGMKNDTYYTSSPAYEYENIQDIGDRIVYLKVNDSSDNWYFFNKTVEVVNVSAYFNVSLDGCAQPGVDLSFTDLSEVSDALHIDSWSWDFDDGNTSNQASPTHNYSATGNFNVTLNVTANNSEYSTYSRIVHIDNVSSIIIPGLSISHDDIIPGDVLTFYSYLIETDSSVDDIYVNITKPDGNYVNYSMSDDDTDPFSYKHSFSNTFDLGWYNVTFWTKDKSGNSEKSFNSFYVSSIFGNKNEGSLNSSIENNITGSKFKVYHYSEADNITAYVYGSESNPAEYQCMIYDGLALEAKTENKTVNQTGWVTDNQYWNVLQ